MFKVAVIAVVLVLLGSLLPATEAASSCYVGIGNLKTIAQCGSDHQTGCVKTSGSPHYYGCYGGTCSSFGSSSSGSISGISYSFSTGGSCCNTDNCNAAGSIAAATALFALVAVAVLAIKNVF